VKKTRDSPDGWYGIESYKNMPGIMIEERFL
jgi:hypothetical protein